MDTTRRYVTGKLRLTVSVLSECGNRVAVGEANGECGIGIQNRIDTCFKKYSW